ncbi:MAG: hypothetical protein JOY60_09165 [Burkholderiaceae bacterium]|nr:hypothetical protein [Burkholderiaceae bacterium]
MKTSIAALGLALILSVCTLARAQEAAQPVGDAEPPLSAASAPMPAPMTTSPPPPSPPSCSQLSGHAMKSDLAAVTAQSQNQPLSNLLALYDASIQAWRAAAERCEGRAKERAEHNLLDNQKQRDALAERQSAGAECEVAHRDAASLQELAHQAFGERRWEQAGALYRKSASMWDFAVESCTGSQQELAVKRREQTEIDGHNAEFCAPLFDQAREFTQKFRNAAAGLALAEKQQQSQMAETLWRKTQAQCKGGAVDLAGNNAQALARERGTPWVATELPQSASVQAPARVVGVAAVPQTTAALATAAAVNVAAGSAAKTAATPVPAPKNVPAAPTTPAAPDLTAAAAPAPKELDVQAGDTHYRGQFVREEGQVVSGTGRVEWASGEVYVGQLLHSQRHGQGEFIWPNGQRYKGDWVMDHPTGHASVHFVNGNQYEGAVVEGQPQGSGLMKYASGDVYQGEMDHGVPHGRGVYTWANGQRFDGDWVHEVPQGRGALRFANGNLYEGPVVAGVPQGKGRLQFASGDIYEGDFTQGKPEGQGSYLWKTGEKYVGAWKAGLKQGQGTFHWANGDRWEGEFVNDERGEDGVLIRKGDE